MNAKSLAGALVVMNLCDSVGCVLGTKVHIRNNFNNPEHVTNVVSGIGNGHIVRRILFPNFHLEQFAVLPVFEGELKGHFPELPFGFGRSLNSFGSKIDQGGGSPSNDSANKNGKGIGNLSEQWHGLPFFLWLIFGALGGYIIATLAFNAAAVGWQKLRKSTH